MNCEYSGLGVYIDGPRIIKARCTCGAVVTVVDGRIPVHQQGVDEAPWAPVETGDQE